MELDLPFDDLNEYEHLLNNNQPVEALEKLHIAISKIEFAESFYCIDNNINSSSLVISTRPQEQELSLNQKTTLQNYENIRMRYYHEAIKLSYDTKSTAEVEDYFSKIKSSYAYNTVIGRSFSNRDEFKNVKQLLIKRGDKDIIYNFLDEEQEIYFKDKSIALIEFYVLPDNSKIVYLYKIKNKEKSIVKWGLFANSNQLSELTKTTNELATNYNEISRKESINKILIILSNCFSKITAALLRQKVAKLILVPHKFLNLLPLHATKVDIDGKKCYIDEYFPITTTICNSTLYDYIFRNKVLPGIDLEAANHMQIVIDVQNLRSGPISLFYSSYFESIMTNKTKDEFEYKTNISNSTSSTMLIDMSKNTTFLLYEGHGFLNISDYKQTGLVTSDGRLTFHEIITHCWPMPPANVILNTCESGTSGISEDLRDDYYGLDAAFLICGSKTVISSMWRINDTASFLLSFYIQYLLCYQTDASVCSVFRAAIQWLRNGDWQSSLETMKNIAQQQVTLMQKSFTEKQQPELANYITKYEKVIQEYFSDLESLSKNFFSDPYYWASWKLSGLGYNLYMQNEPN